MNDADHTQSQQVRLRLPHGTTLRIVDFLPIKNHPTEEGAAQIPVDFVWESRGRLSKRRAKYLLQRWVLSALCAGLVNGDDRQSASFIRRTRRERYFVAKHIKAEAVTPVT